jgi:hypothetical protein
MKREPVLHCVLGGHVQHSGYFTQNRLVLVPVLVTLDENDAISLIDGEVDSSELFRARAAKMDRGLSVRGITSGREEFIESLLFFLSPLMGLLSVVSFEVLLQMESTHETGLATIRRTDMGMGVVVSHFVVLQVPPFDKCRLTIRDFALERSLTRMNPLMHCGSTRMHSLTTPFEPTQHFSVLQSPPLWSPALGSRSRRRRTGATVRTRGSRSRRRRWR